MSNCDHTIRHKTNRVFPYVRVNGSAYLELKDILDTVEFLLESIIEQSMP